MNYYLIYCCYQNSLHFRSRQQRIRHQYHHHSNLLKKRRMSSRTWLYLKIIDFKTSKDNFSEIKTNLDVWKLLIIKHKKVADCFLYFHRAQNCWRFQISNTLTFVGSNVFFLFSIDKRKTTKINERQTKLGVIKNV